MWFSKIPGIQEENRTNMWKINFYPRKREKNAWMLEAFFFTRALRWTEIAGWQSCFSNIVSTLSKILGKFGNHAETKRNYTTWNDRLWKWTTIFVLPAVGRIFSRIWSVQSKLTPPGPGQRRAKARPWGGWLSSMICWKGILVNFLGIRHLLKAFKILWNTYFSKTCEKNLYRYLTTN